MKRLLSLFLFSILFVSAYSQKLVVDTLSELTSNLEASTNPRVDENKVPCALVKVQLVGENAEFKGQIVGDVKHVTSEYYVYLAADSKRVNVTLPGYLPLDIKFSDYGIAKLKSKTTYKLVILKLEQGMYKEKKKFFKSSGGCLNAGYQIGTLTGAGIGVGGYIANINLEFDYTLGLSKSGDVYWNAPSADQKPTVCNYKAQYIGGKIGYGILLSNRLRLTPQLGFGVNMINGTTTNAGAVTGVDKTYAASASLGVNLNFALTPWMGVFLSPQYGIAVKKGKIYEALSPVSGKVKGYGQGFNCLIGINFFL